MVVMEEEEEVEMVRWSGVVLPFHLRDAVKPTAASPAAWKDG